MLEDEDSLRVNIFFSFSLVFDCIGCFREYFWKMYLLRHIAVLTQLPTAKLWLKWFYIISIYIYVHGYSLHYLVQYYG